MLDQKTLLSLKDTAAILDLTTDRVLSMVSNRMIDVVMKNGWKFFDIEEVVKVHTTMQDERNRTRYDGRVSKIFEKATKNWWD